MAAQNDDQNFDLPPSYQGQGLPDPASGSVDDLPPSLRDPNRLKNPLVKAPDSNPVLDEVTKSGAMDDAVYSPKLEEWTKQLKKQQEDIRNGVFGTYGVAEPGAERDAAMAAREADLTAAHKSIESMRAINAARQADQSGLAQFLRPINDALTSLPSPVDFIMRDTGYGNPSVPANVDAYDRATGRGDDALSKARTNPDQAITADSWTGFSRDLADRTAQSLIIQPAQAIEAIGQGAALAGWQAGADDKVQDNALKASSRMMSAWVQAAFPGDTTRQEQFFSQAAQGMGSMAGFMAMNQAGIALKVGQSGQMVMVGLLGALTQAGQQDQDLYEKRASGKDISDQQLMLGYVSGLVLGSTEALPIVANMPGLTPQTKGKLQAFLTAINREGIEQFLQEFGQNLSQNIISKYGLPGYAPGWDPDSNVWDTVGRSALIGYLTGSLAQAAKLGASSSARAEALHEAANGNLPAYVQLAMSRSQTRAPGQAPVQAPVTTAPSQTQAAPATPADPRIKEFDLNKYATPSTGADQAPVQPGYPAAQVPPSFDPAREIAGSARMKPGAQTDSGATAQQAVQQTAPPTFQEMTAYLPVDHNGDADMDVFHEVAQQVSGKERPGWPGLTDEEKDRVVRALAGDETALAPQASPVEQVANGQRVPFASLRTGQTTGQTTQADQAKPQAPQGVEGVAQPAGVPAADSRFAGASKQISAADDAALLAKARSGSTRTDLADATKAPLLANAAEHDRAIRALDREIEDKQAEITEAETKANTEAPGKSRRAASATLTSAKAELQDLQAERKGLSSGRDAAATAEAAQGNLFDPATTLAKGLNEAGKPAATWPQQAIQAGERAGLVRIDPEGVPRRTGLANVTADIGPVKIDDAKRSELRELASAAAGAMVPARFGETHAQGDPVAIRALVDSVAAFTTEQIKAEFAPVARLGRLRNREQIIARSIQGFMARELASQNEDYRLSNAARDLIDQTVEDALAGKPIAATVETVATDAVITAVVDEVRRIAKHVDADAIELVRSPVAEAVPVMQALADQVNLNGVGGVALDMEQMAELFNVARTVHDRVTKRDGVHAPEKTIDEIVAESGEPKDRGPDQIRDYTNVVIDGYQGTHATDRNDVAYSSIKEGFLKDGTKYLKAVAKELADRGFGPHMIESRGRKGSKPKAMAVVNANPGGPAVSGDISLSTVDPDGNGVYVNIGTGITGPKGGITLMARKASTADRYGTKSQNLWWPNSLTVKELADRLEKLARPTPPAISGVTAGGMRVVVNTLNMKELQANYDAEDAIKASLPVGVTVEVSDRRLKGEEARLKGGEVKAIARRQSPYSVEDGYGATPAEALENALRKLGVKQEASIVTSDDITIQRSPESVVDGLIAVGGKPVSPAARSHAIALEKIGSDGKLFFDLKPKLAKLLKADLDAVAELYGANPEKGSKFKTKKQALDAIEKQFNWLTTQEADAATLSGNVGILTRDNEDHAADRRRAERNNRIRESQRALSDGGISGGLQEDEGGREPGSALEGRGRGSADLVQLDRGADQVEGAQGQSAVPGASQDATASPSDSERTGDARRYSDPAIVAAAVQAEKERKARRRANYRITDEDEIGLGGPKAKVRANIEAIKIAKELQQFPDRMATTDEKKILVKYTGWGAFAQDVFADHKPEWKTERQQLIDLLSSEEYDAAKASTLNAHYTSRDVINGMWDAMGHLGFTGGRAIEPSAGVGHFIGLTPTKLANKTDWTAVELDKITGTITKALYAGADVRVQGYETVQFPDNFFDLAISNVPFGNFTLTDRQYPKLLIHDYFFAKSLDKVRPGGLVAFITSSGTMDKENATARRLIDSKADFIGAIRLPGGNKGAFAGNAGTEVTTDIIFLRKRGAGEELGAEPTKWLDSVEHQTPDGPTKINQYFAANPDMMLGEMRLTGSMYTAKSPVLVGPSENLRERIAQAASLMPSDVFAEKTSATQDAGQTVELAASGIKEGAFYLKGGKLFQNVTGQAIAQKATGNTLKRLRGLMDMRDLVNDLLASSAQGKPEALPNLRNQLNAKYDAFVKAFGPINKETVTVQKRKGKDGEVREITTTRYPNLTGFEDDPDAYKVAAIENYDSETGKASKRAIFTTDIVGAYQRPEVTGPADALAVSLNETGGIDINRVAQMLKVSEPEAAAALGERAYLNPNGEAYEPSEIYLSGDVVTKLEQAREAAKTNADYQRNVHALEAVQPAPLTRVDIRTTFGSPWIPKGILNEFIAKTLGVRGEVKFEPISSTWVWDGGQPYVTPAAQAAFGTERVNVRDLVMAALNDKPVHVFDKGEGDSRVLNVEATQQAAIKSKLIAETFTGDPNAGLPGWVWEDDSRAQKLEAIYNDTFNRLVPTKYDGSHLTLPGLATTMTTANGQTIPFELRPHQKNVIWRAIQSGNVLMDHAVGAGKTLAMISSAMEMKRLGQIQRPLFAVPNHMLEQFSREFLQAYPNAKILVADKSKMEAKNRKAFAARVAADSWDGIIMTHSAFGRIPMQDQAYIDFMKAEIDEVIEAYEEAKRESNGKDPTVKAIERKKKMLETKLDKLLAKENKDTGVRFEELGVDKLIVDEAHLYKNLDMTSRHSNVKGIGVKGSQRATDLFLKIQHLEKAKPGRSTIFATGTPMSRSMAEIYTMQRYLQNDLLREYGVHRFDTWAATFGQIINQMELAPNGRDIKETTSFSRFVNVPELQALYSRVADSVTANDLNLPRPALKTGQPQMVKSQLSGDEEDEIQRVIREIAALKGPVEKGKANHLSLFTKGLQISTDMRLIDPSAEFNPDGKVARVVDKVSEIYKAGVKPALAQMIFLDMGVPNSKAKSKIAVAKSDIGDESKIGAIRDKLAGNEDDFGEDDQNQEVDNLLAGKFNLYDDIKSRLVAAGVPEKEIAFIHDAKNDQQKAVMFKAVRDGKIRVLLGSSSKMGVGTNVQRYLTAMHHVDAPWNPADVVQRDGRIVRQGNENKEVSIFRYITERSFEAYRWQLLDRKAQFEAQFRAGARGMRDAEDIDSPLPEASDLKAAASGDPRIMEYATLTKQLRELEAAKRGHERSYLNAQRSLATTKSEIAQREDALAKYEQDAPMVKDLSGTKFKMRLDTASAQGPVTERKVAGEAIRNQILSELRNHWGREALRIELGEISGFKMVADGRRSDRGYTVEFSIEGAATYRPASGTKLITPDSDPFGIAIQYANIVQGVPTVLKNTQAVLAQKQSELPRLEKASVPTAFPRAAQMAIGKARLEELEAALKPKDQNAPPAPSTIGDLGDVTDELSALRSPDRAIEILDRAARMSGFRASIFDQNPFDRQMRTPNRTDSPLGNLNLIPNSMLQSAGVQTVPLSKIKTDQSTISVKVAKSKVFESPDTVKRPQVLEYDGTYWVLDGNHFITSRRALGEKEIEVQVLTAKSAAGGEDAPASGPTDAQSIADAGYQHLKDALTYEERLWLEGLDPKEIAAAISKKFGLELPVDEIVKRERFKAGRNRWDGILDQVNQIGERAKAGIFDPADISRDQRQPRYGEEPFVGEKEARYQEDMRRHTLRQTVLKELADEIGSQRSAVSGVEPGREGGETVSGTPGAQDATGSSAASRAIREGLADPRRRSLAIEGFLADELKADAIEDRAYAQSFTINAVGDVTDEGMAKAGPFGTRLKVKPDGGLPLIARIAQVMGLAKEEPSTGLDLKVRAENPLRMPNIEGLKYGQWHQPQAWLAGVAHPDYEGPESLKRFIKDWTVNNNPIRERANRVDQRFALALSNELQRLGYDAVTFRDLDLAGRDNLIPLDPSQVRAATDTFHDDAAGATGLNASDDYLEQDVTDRIAELLREDGQQSGQEVYSFDDLNRGDEQSAFAGVKAVGAPKSLIPTAERMEKNRKTPAQILEITGWQRGPDGKWRFEIDDSKASLKPLDQVLTVPQNTFLRSMVGLKSKQAPKWVEGKVRVGKAVPLGSILSHDKLFAAYPFLQKMTVNMIVGPGVPKAKEGGELVFRKKGGGLVYSPIAVRAKTEGEVLKTLMHEIQHYIQIKEGFAQGSAPSRVKPLEAFKADFSKPQTGPLLYPGRTFSTSTQSNADSIDRTKTLPTSLAEDLAASIAKLHQERENGETTAYLGHEGWLTASWSPENKVVPIDEAIGYQQAKLVNLLTVTSQDYVNSVGEAEANAVMERLKMTPEQRRKSLVDLGVANNTESVTRDFASAADEMLRRAQFAERARAERRKPVSIAPGISIREYLKDGDYRVNLDRRHGHGSNLWVRIDAEGGHAVIELGELGRTDVGLDVDSDNEADVTSVTDAELNRMVDATEAWLRKRNITPTADVRFLPGYQGPSDANATHHMTDNDFAFWRKRDPYFMMDTEQARRFDQTSGDADAILIQPAMEMPYDLRSARLDDEAWKARTAEHAAGISNEERLALLNGMKETLQQQVDAERAEEQANNEAYHRNQSGRQGQEAWRNHLAKGEASRKRIDALHKRRSALEYAVSVGPMKDTTNAFQETRAAWQNAERSMEDAFHALSTDEVFLKEALPFLQTDNTDVKSIEQAKDFFAHNDASTLSYFGLEGKLMPLIEKASPAWVAAQRTIETSRAELERLGKEIDAAGGMSPYLFDRRHKPTRYELREIEREISERAFGATNENADKVKASVLEGGMPMFALAGTEPGNLRLTPEAQQAYPAVVAELTKKLRKMLPADVAVSFSNQLMSARGQEQYGRFRPEIRLIELAMKYGPQKALEIGAHEVVHVLKNAGAFTDAEWGSLVERAKKLDLRSELESEGLISQYESAYDAQARKMGLDPDLREAFVARRIEEELVARLAEHHFGLKQSRFGATIDGLLQRMRDILDAIVSAFNGQGLTSPEAVFRRMQTGKIAERVPAKPQKAPVQAKVSGPARDDAKEVAGLWSHEMSAFGGSLPKGYSVSHVTDRIGRTNYKIMFKSGPLGRVKEVGNAYVRDLGDKVQVGRISIDDKHTRKGVATALYAQIERDLGKPLVPDGTLSRDALALWQKHRPEAVSQHRVLENGEAVLDPYGMYASAYAEPPKATPAAREAAARKIMESPEWANASARENVAPENDTSRVANYGSEEWRTSRKYADGIVGFDAVVNRVVEKATAAVPGGPALERKAFLVIGYPGAGKSTTSKALSRRYRAAIVVGDDAKTLIPEYNGGKNNGGVKAESDDISSAAAVQLMASGTNLIQETSGTADGVARYISTLKADGYTVSLVHVDVPKHIAMERAVKRYQTDGRPVPLRIYDTLDAKSVYDSNKAKGTVDETARIEPTQEDANGRSGWTVADASTGLDALRTDLNDPASGNDGVRRGAGEQGVRAGSVGTTGSEGLSNSQIRSAMRAQRAQGVTLPGGVKVHGVNLVEGSAPADNELSAFKAYHGSPHDFDRFSLDKIGTGEGAQAFGHGLYFADSEGVAKSYRDALSIDYSPGAVAANWLKRNGGDRQKTLKQLESNFGSSIGDDLKEAHAILSRGDEPAALQGKMYQVRINADPEHFLDWDKPLSQQSEKVRGAIEVNIKDRRVIPYGDQWKAEVDSDLLGKQATQSQTRPTREAAQQWLDGLGVDDLVGKGVVASQRLADAGIPGIKYLDQGSRAAGEGSRNYVVFDDKLIEITHKDGKPVDTSRPFALDGFDNTTVTTTPKSDGLRTRTYTVAGDGKTLAAVALSERESNIWEVIGLRLDRDHQGKGLVRKVLDAIEADTGRPTWVGGIITPETYQMVSQAAPELVRFHVDGGTAYDGMYLSPKAVEMMRQSATDAADSSNGDAASTAAREREVLKMIEGAIPDGKYSVDRVIDGMEMSALAPRTIPPQLQQLGDTSKTDTEAPEQSLSDLIKMVTEALKPADVRQGRLNPALKASMGRLGAKVFGQTSRSTGIVRMAIPNDFQTLTHEGGHVLESNRELGGFIEGIKQSHSAELIPLATPGPDELSEGFAEWFRTYLVDPRDAQAKAPQTTAAFRNMLEAEQPELLTALDAIQAAYASLLSASPAGSVKGRTQTTVKTVGMIANAREEIAEKGFHGAMSDWMYAATNAAIDDSNPMKAAVKYLLDEATRQEETKNGPLPKGQVVRIQSAINDPYKLMRMMKHSVQQATAMLKNGVVQKGRALPSGPSMQSVLTEAFGGSDKALWNDDMHQNFGAYLVARRMNAEWDRFDQGYLDGPPDQLMGRDVWRGAERDLSTAYPQFVRAGRLLDTFVRNTLSWKLDNGFLTQEQYEDFANRDGYAPLNRIMDENGPSSLNAKGNNKRQMVFRFQGSTRDFINPIESVVADVYRTHQRVLMNDVIKKLDTLSRAAGPNGGRIAERIPANDMRAKDLNLQSTMERLKKESAAILQKSGIDVWDANGIMNELDMVFDQQASESVFSAVPTSEKGDRIVYLWENGKKVPIQLGTDQLGKDIFEMFVAVGKPNDLGIGMEQAVFFTQLFRAGVTKSPPYVVVNWFRDQLSTWVLSRNYTPFWHGFKGMAQVYESGDVAKRYQYWAGMSGGIDGQLIDGIGKDRDVLQLRRSGFLAARTTFESALRIMETGETASRYAHMEANYQRLISEGFSEEEAAFESAYNAHDVMDFSRRGAKMVNAARLVAFMNAQLQGLSVALRTMRGERDDYVTIRDAISPYLKSTEGSPLTVAEKEALPNSVQIWMKLASIGLIGLALAMNYKDDPEYEEMSKSEMGETHWFFKLNGTWWRVPKPFELAIFSNLFEAMFAKLAQNDPLAPQRFLKSMRDTLLVGPEMQVGPALTSLYNTIVKGPLDYVTGKSQYDKAKDDLPQRLKGLPAEMQFDAYTSEFSKMLAKMTGMSPYKTDNLIRSLFASLGRDALTVSDYLLPMVNQATGGALPGVSTDPRADKSFEDYIFLSRITRRSSRGANSTFNFWQEMSQDNGRFTESAKGYHKLLSELKQPREAQQMLMGLDDDRKAYALLQEHYKEQDKDLHPLNRAKQVVSAITGIRQQMANNALFVEKTNNKKWREADQIKIDPSTQRVINEILEDMSLREVRNAQIVLGKKGWAQRAEMPVDGLWTELKAASPQVADELFYRITHGKNKVYSYEAVKDVWPEVRTHLLTEDPGSSLSSLHSRAKTETPRTMP